MSATKALIFEIVVRTKNEEGVESDRVMGFDTSEKQPSFDEVFAAAEKVKEEESVKEGFVGVMVRRTFEIVVFDQVNAKTASVVSSKTVQTTLV